MGKAARLAAHRRALLRAEQNPSAVKASRLPDLPHAGYSTKAQKALSDAMMVLIRGFERDRVLLLKVVQGGGVKWRQSFLRNFRWLHADSDLADAVFGYLVRLANLGGRDYSAQIAKIELGQQQTRRQSWDHRRSTLIRLAKDQRELFAAIAKEEAKVQKRSVRVFLS